MSGNCAGERSDDESVLLSRHRFAGLRAQVSGVLGGGRTDSLFRLAKERGWSFVRGYAIYLEHSCPLP